MGLFSGLFRARDAPQNRTSGSAYSFFLGNSTSGKRVNERTSMQMTAVYSCVRILSEAVAGLIDTRTMAGRRKQRTIRCIFCSMTNRTRR